MATRTSERSGIGKSITNSLLYQTASDTPFAESQSNEFEKVADTGAQLPLKYEDQSSVRDKYFDSYISNLQNQNAKQIDKSEQLFIEKLLAQDRLIQKQMSLVNNYGRKQFRNTSQNLQQKKPYKQLYQTQKEGGVFSQGTLQPLFLGQYTR